MSDEIKPGDTVQLKSGGPDMTVDYVVPRSSDRVLIAGCVWFEGSKPAKHDFPVHVLSTVSAGGA